MDYNSMRMAVVRSTSATYMADCFRRAFKLPTECAAKPAGERRPRDGRYDGARKLMKQRYGALDRG